jgi:hypothetical protein
MQIWFSFILNIIKKNSNDSFEEVFVNNLDIWNFFKMCLENYQKKI